MRRTQIIIYRNLRIIIPKESMNYNEDVGNVKIQAILCKLFSVEKKSIPKTPRKPLKRSLNLERNFVLLQLFVQKFMNYIKHNRFGWLCAFAAIKPFVCMWKQSWKPLSSSWGMNVVQKSLTISWGHLVAKSDVTHGLPSPRLDFLPVGFKFVQLAGRHFTAKSYRNNVYRGNAFRMRKFQQKSRTQLVQRNNLSLNKLLRSDQEAIPKMFIRFSFVCFRSLSIIPNEASACFDMFFLNLSTTNCIFFSFCFLSMEEKRKMWVSSTRIT